MLSRQADRDPRFADILKWYQRGNVNHTGFFVLRHDIYITTNPSGPNGDLISKMSFPLGSYGPDFFKRSLISVLDEVESDRKGIRIFAVSAEITRQTDRSVHSRHRPKTELQISYILAALISTIWSRDWCEETMIKQLLLRPEIVDRPIVPQLPTGVQAQDRRPLAPFEMVERPLEAGTHEWDDAVYLEWQWLSEFRNFNNDVEVFVQEPYKTAPHFDYFRVLLLSTDVLNARKLVVVASSSNLLKRMVDARVLPDAVEYEINGHHAEESTVLLPPGINAQLIQLISRIYNLIRMDTLEYVTQARNSIADIVCA